jgi:hypothetical protein
MGGNRLANALTTAGDGLLQCCWDTRRQLLATQCTICEQLLAIAALAFISLQRQAHRPSSTYA